MKNGLSEFSRRYQAALRRHLKQALPARLDAARKLGGTALDSGLRIADVAKLHEQTVVAALPPGCPVRKRGALIARAGLFLAAAVTPMERNHGGLGKANGRLGTIIGTLSRRTVELAASNRKLSLEIALRKAVELALKERERHYSQSLERSDRLKEQLRRLSRQVLSAQEDERKRISRELHDVVAQALSGINLRLAILRRQASVNTKNLDRNIALTQRLVEKSAKLVSRFARDLRPAVLDDLGLIPAMHSFLKGFAARTGILTRLTAYGGADQLDAARRTVLYRVAQEALTNVARHARAKRVWVSLQRRADTVRLKVRDDGCSFHVQRVLLARGGRRLGLLGMRERTEMVGGRFHVESAPGKGTAVTAEIPDGRAGRGKAIRAGRPARRKGA